MDLKIFEISILKIKIKRIYLRRIKMDIKICTLCRQTIKISFLKKKLAKIDTCQEIRN